MNGIIRCERVFKIYHPFGPHQVRALVDISVSIERGSFTLLRGPSGSGKSTLLGILGALDRPSSGTVHLDGSDLSALSRNGLASLRRRKIGLVFQTHHLVRGLPAWENVSLPLVPAGIAGRERKRRAEEVLASLGLGDRISHPPEELSVGEQQRVAVARALINDPDILILDEPTAALDEAASFLLIDILVEGKRRGKTILVSSHDESIVPYADGVLELRRGVLAENRSSVLS